MRVARSPPRAPGAVMHGALSINSFRRSRPQQQIMLPVPALPDPAQLAAAGAAGGVAAGVGAAAAGSAAAPS